MTAWYFFFLEGSAHSFWGNSCILLILLTQFSSLFYFALGTAFFPLQSCMNHSCCPNAKAFKREEVCPVYNQSTYTWCLYFVLVIQCRYFNLLLAQKDTQHGPFHININPPSIWLYAIRGHLGIISFFHDSVSHPFWFSFAGQRWSSNNYCTQTHL